MRTTEKQVACSKVPHTALYTQTMKASTSTLCVYLYSALYWLYRVPIGFIRMVKLSPYESVMSKSKIVNGLLMTVADRD